MGLKRFGGYILKRVEEQEYYFGRDITRKTDLNRNRKSTLSAIIFIGNDCEKVKRTLSITCKNENSPIKGGYHPKLDLTDMIDDDKVSKYYMLIGSLNKAVTLGRADIMFVATTLACYSCTPRKRLPKNTPHVFSY